MKKIIFLLLMPFISMAQIPAPKSTTTFSNISATGNLTVNGTARVTGATTLTGAAKQTNTLNYEGNTTWNSNATATLTTGNTGTVAVLSDAVFGMKATSGVFNPADATTYYVFSLPQQSQTEGLFKYYVPYNCTLVGYSANVYSGGLSSTESATLDIITQGVSSSTTNITNSLVQNTSVNTYTSNALSVNLNTGTYIELRYTCPTWATNPTSAIIDIQFWFVRRQ